MAKMQHMSVDEIKLLLKAIPNKRNRLMVLVAYHHALRVSELISLTGKDLRDGHINAKRLKGSENTIQPYVYSSDKELSEGESLTELVGTIGPSDRAFPMTRDGVLKLIKRSGTLAGLPRHKLHPHALKHSIAYELVGKLPINIVQAHLGHKSLASTGRYTLVTQDEVSKAIAGVFA